jgi:predicted lysophospholipase L1 biosynthesis ABC-type transport system permease subunit
MPWLARLRSFKRNTLQRALVERELADEASSVCELLAEEKMRQGMAPAAAWRSARLELGGVESWKEEVRAVRSGAWLAEPAGLLPAIRAQVRAVDPDQPVTDVGTIAEHLARSLSQPRFGMLLLSLFAGVALLLAAIGVYGVVAYEARQRTHEIGIRTAIGARPAHILRLIVGDGLRLSLLGAALGIAAALPATRLLASLLYGVGRCDPLTFLAMPACLVAAALAAWLPARRALRLDPVAALRHE